jgi:eukaryotic-like serine/threonine-protein kinase
MQGSEGVPPGSIPVKNGDVLAGKYRVERVLGVGGMGIVVAATHLQLDQKVALKFMLPDALKLPALLERFAREARAAVRLKSDHVARVLDVGTLDSGSPYMVMEYLEGSDLGAMIESRGALPIDTAVDFVLQACDAVAEAHSVGIVHRDLKPRNLFVTHRNDGRALVKVLDFGIAKQTVGGADLSLTKTTEVMGSPNYMSPEQLRASKGADERSDIWALGVILYELLTGALPFVAESVTQLILMVLSESPRPIRLVRVAVPDDLARAIERCLEKNPAARFGSVADLAAALEPFAPADSRGLAMRIARITSGGRVFAPSPATTTHPVDVPTHTTANWSARPGLARSWRGKLVGLAVVVCIAGAAAILGTVSASRSRTAPPIQALGSPTPTPTPTGTPTGTPTASPTPTTTTTPTATTTASPLATSVLIAPPPASRAVGSALVADAGGGHPARPRQAVVVPADSTPSSEPPKYRTSW